MAAKRIAFGALFVTALALALAGCGTKNETLPSVPVDSNLVVNPSFEQWNGNLPIGWQVEFFEGQGKKENYYGKSLDAKRTGSFSFYSRGVYDTDRWMVLAQRHPVIPGYRLVFAAEMKADGLEKNKHFEDKASVYVRFYDRKGNRLNDRYFADSWTGRIYGTNDWRRFERIADIPKNARTVDIGIVNTMNGFLYVDDVELKVTAPLPWKEEKTKYVDFYYLDGHPFPQGEVEKEADFVDACVKMLHVKVKDKVSYYYYPSEKKFQDIIGVKRGHERVYFQKHELHTTDPAERHNVIHFILEPIGSPPFGLFEAAVYYCLGSWEDGRDLHMMTKQFLMEKRLPALYMILKQQDMDKLGMSIAVPAWASFSVWLINRYGIDKFMKLYTKTDGIEEVGTFNSIFKDIYGDDFDMLDRSWRLWVLRYQPKQPGRAS